MSQRESQLKEEIKKAEEGEILHIKPSSICQNGHEFIRVKSNEAKCIKCPVGYLLSPGTEIRNKHIYIKGQFLI